MIEVIFGILGILIYLLCLTLPLQHRLLLVLACSVPQLYLFQINGTDIPIAFMCAMLLLPEFFFVANRFLAKMTNLTLLTLIFVSLISLLWSPIKSIGFRDIAYLIEFLIISAAVFRLALLDVHALYKVINITLLFICLQAFTIILFRLNEKLEVAIVLSPISRYFLGGNTLDGLLNGVRNNFYDPVKAGGILFVNANAAACYVGIASFMAYGIYKVAKTKLTLVMAFFLWITVFFTGSKAGVLLAIAIPSFIIYLKLNKSSRTLVFIVSSILFLLLSTLSVIFGVMEQHSFVLQSTETAESRYHIWKYALDAFIENPLMGQGFGGWENDYNKYSDYYLPPHNTLIFLWSKSGLLASLLGMLFMLSCIRLALKGIKNNEAREISFAFLMVVLWLFIHGFGENFGLIGEQHQLIILAVMLGLCQAGNEPMKLKRKV